MCRLEKGLLGLVLWVKQQGWLVQAVRTDNVSRGKGVTAGANGLWVGLLPDTGGRAPSLLARLWVVSVLLTNMQRKTAKYPEQGKDFQAFFLFEKSYILVEGCKIFCIMTFLSLSQLSLLPPSFNNSISQPVLNNVLLGSGLNQKKYIKVFAIFPPDTKYIAH